MSSRRLDLTNLEPRTAGLPRDHMLAVDSSNEGNLSDHGGEKKIVLTKADLGIKLFKSEIDI